MEPADLYQSWYSSTVTEPEGGEMVEKESDGDEIVEESSVDYPWKEPLIPTPPVDKGSIPEMSTATGSVTESPSPTSIGVHFCSNTPPEPTNIHQVSPLIDSTPLSIKSYDTIDSKRYSNDDDDSCSSDEDSDFEDEICINFEQLRQKDSPFYSDKVTVAYEGKSHLGLMCQLHGSVWKHVLPYCIVNVVWTYFISYLLREGQTDITLPDTGHKFMVILVSFLVVSRVQITYQRFVEARNDLGGCFRSCRELMHDICILTQDSDGVEAKEWRKCMAEKVLNMLRITIGAIEFSSRGVNPWKFLPPRENTYSKLVELTNFLRMNARPDRTVQDDALRAPLIYSCIIRSEILAPEKSNCLKRKLSGPEELRLLGHVTEFTSACHELIKLITTPFPFPLVQMTRTILFAWLFTLPLSLVDDAGAPWEDMIMIFFVTYGFLGLEYVSIELDDPFGNDDNDFDNLGMAQRVYEDIYMTLFDSDGQEAAESLRKTMSSASYVKWC